MIRTVLKSVIFILPLFFTSCIKDGYDSVNCPGEYTITPLHPELSQIGGEEITGATVTIIDSEGNEHTVKAGSDQPIDLDDGTYTIVASKGVEESEATIDKTVISVATNPDGSAKDLPDDLVGGYTDITAGGVSADQGNVNFDIPTRIQTRPLIINLKFEGNNSSLIEGIAGTVEGIALSRDLNNGFTPTDGQDRHPAIQAGNIHYAFNKDAGQDMYTDNHRLLGIDGEGVQTLTFTVDFGGGVQKTYTFDITRKMDGFHTEDVLTPWVIEITLRLGADFTADIEDWQWGPESWMDAH